SPWGGATLAAICAAEIPHPLQRAGPLPLSADGPRHATPPTGRAGRHQRPLPFQTVLGRTLALIRHVRFRLWARATDARLRRLGGRFILDAPQTPRYLTLPRVEIDEGGGTLTLRIGRECKLGRDVVLDLAPREDGLVGLGDRVTL